MRLERLYALAEEIRRHAPVPVSATVLAEHFGVSRRTIERDLVTLRDAGVPLYAITGRRGGQSLVAGTGRAPLTLSVAEAAALLLAVHATTGMPYGGAAQAATRRLLDVLPGAARVEVDDLARRIRTTAVDAARADRRVFDVVEEAVRVGGVVRLRYLDREARATTRDVEAVGFHGAADGWYLIAWCRLRRAGRVFRLDRIRRATLTAERVPRRDVDATLGWVPGTPTTPG